MEQSKFPGNMQVLLSSFQIRQSFERTERETNFRKQRLVKPMNGHLKANGPHERDGACIPVEREQVSNNSIMGGGGGGGHTRGVNEGAMYMKQASL